MFVNMWANRYLFKRGVPGREGDLRRRGEGIEDQTALHAPQYLEEA
jgi:hypothetical protein